VAACHYRASVPEGLSAAEVGKEIAEHRRRLEELEGGGDGGGDDSGGDPTARAEHRDRWLSIVEAVLLSLVAVIAAYSGFAAAKWGTESSISLAKASALRTKASRADLEALVTRTEDSVSFNAWFTAYVAGNRRAEQLAERRLRPGYRPAFNAWLATDPATNPHSPPGPSYMPQYVIPQEVQANADDAQADAEFTTGSAAGATSDKYVRDTVFLATVLFLVGISGHFRIRSARLAVVGFGVLILAFSLVQLAGLPAPP
jgi:hypothetical protein